MPGTFNQVKHDFAIVGCLETFNKSRANLNDLDFLRGGVRFPSNPLIPAYYNEPVPSNRGIPPNNIFISLSTNPFISEKGDR